MQEACLIFDYYSIQVKYIEEVKGKKIYLSHITAKTTPKTHMLGKDTLDPPLEK